MTRKIEISTDVFARIWSLRQEGEDTEDQILKRILSHNMSNEIKDTINKNHSGYFDNRHNVSFAEGFEIFREYKGERFQAKVKDGKWLLENNGRFYESLNALSRAVVSGSENAWVSWNYVQPDGNVSKIASLRDKLQISRRTKSITNRNPYMNMEISVIWRDDVVQALENLGGTAHLDDIYEEVNQIRQRRDASIPESLEAVVRRELEYNSSDSESFTGRFDLFYSVEGIGSGVWGLRKLKKTG